MCSDIWRDILGSSFGHENKKHEYAHPARKRWDGCGSLAMSDCEFGVK
jgi:hypothetical protein